MNPANVNAIVFLGPTLPLADAEGLLPADYQPPVSQGDVYRAALQRPSVIGIIDGYFDQVPAVWHKEILWALREGIPVIGGASMGALRAVELAPFGMEGVGEVFTAFSSGQLDGDDEVAIAHAPAEFGYRPLSEAMVNIRATIEVAITQAIIDPPTARRFVDLAKQTFYPDRTWPGLLALAVAAGLNGAAERLRTWLPCGRVDRKRLDAVALLERVATLARTTEPAPAARFSFEHTSTWETARREAGLDGATCQSANRILEEARLRGDLWPRLSARARERALATMVADHQGGHIDQRSLARAAAERRRERGLVSSADVADWASACELDEAAWTALVERDAKVQRGRLFAARNLTTELLDELRWNGSYGELAAAADRKRRCLEHAGVSGFDLTGLNCDPDEAIDWFWRTTYPGVAPPPTDSLDDAAARHGFDDTEDFILAVARHRFARTAS